LKLGYDESLSNFAFNCNLRRYNVASADVTNAALGLVIAVMFFVAIGLMVRRCSLTQG
jgi:hypothetical protein